MTTQRYPVTSKAYENKSKKSTFRYLWEYVPKDTIPLLVISGATAYTIYHNSKIINISEAIVSDLRKGNLFQDNNNKNSLVKKLGFLSLGAFTSFLRTYFIDILEKQTKENIMQKVFRALLYKDQEFYDDESSGEISSTFQKDVKVSSEAVTSTTINFIRGGLSTLNNFLQILMILKQNFLPVLFFPASGLGFMAISMYLNRLKGKFSKLNAQMDAFVGERISNIKTVRFFSREDFEFENYKALSSQLEKISRQIAFWKSLRMGTSSLMLNIGMVCTIIYASNLLEKKKISQAGLYSVIFHSAMLSLSLYGTFSSLGHLNEGLRAGERIFKLIEGSESDEEKALCKTLPNVQGEITFDNVSFSYLKRKEKSVLSNVSFTARAGEIVAIVGASGAGKSTILSLLTKLYKPNQGSIYLDGTDIQDLDGKWLREHVISVVDQEPVLFQGTIMENIKYSDPTATDEQATQAAQKANAHDFISKFPNGYQTDVGVGSGLLSTGQKQRIAIARAILKHPRILILDEATSALDHGSEVLIQEALQHIAQNLTVIVISHRPFLIERANSIIVLNDGHIDQIGTYAELINQPNGILPRMFKHFRRNN